MRKRPDVLRYAAGVKHPHWREVASTMRDTVEWFDDTFADETKYRRVRCGARMSEDIVTESEGFKLTRSVAIHRNTCGVRHGIPGLMEVHVKDQRATDSLRRTTSFTATLSAMYDKSLYGEASLTTSAMSRPTYYERGLDTQQETSWIEMFENPEQFASYVALARNLGSGAMTIPEAAHLMIEELSGMSLGYIAVGAYADTQLAS